MNEELHKYLNDFAKSIVKQSRSNLTRNKKNASKSLYNSLGYDLETHRQSFSLSFEMDSYGMFVDQGVKGKKNQSKAPQSPFKFRGKSSNGKFEKEIDGWIKRRGIKGRDKKGRFIKRKSLNFLIRRSIINNGIKPSLFFTKPFERAFKRLPNEVVEKFGLDIDELLKEALNIK